MLKIERRFISTPPVYARRAIAWRVVHGPVQARLIGPTALGVGNGRQVHWLCALAAAVLSYLFSCDSGVPQPCRSVVQVMEPFPLRLRFDLSLLVASSPKTSRRQTMLSPLSSTTSRMREL